jgi:hypothetical protein
MTELGLTEGPVKLTMPRRASTRRRTRTSSSERARRVAAAVEAETAAAAAAGLTRKQYRGNLLLLAEAGALPERHALGAPRVKVAGHGAHARERYTLRNRKKKEDGK